MTRPAIVTDTHESITQGLNTEQLKAVCAIPSRHYLVLAGAGCGKTTVLTRRIVWLYNQGIHPEEILALTFTRKAAEEMSLRLRSLMDRPEKESFPTVTTFHAFALSVLSNEIDGRVNFHRIGFSSKPRLCSERDRLSLLSLCSTNAEREALSVDLLELDAIIERLTVFPDFKGDLSADQLSSLKKISSEFMELKRKRGLWDFSDLIEGVLTLFLGNPSILEQYRKRFSIILVDEFQDTNPIQIRLLRMILGRDRRLFAVGDDDQAIYAFRGADIGPTLSFTEYFPDAEILKLQINYRSVPSILKKANGIFAGKDPVYRKVLISGKYGNDKRNRDIKPLVYKFKNQEFMADWIAAKMKSLSKLSNIPTHEMAALFRVNQTADMLSTYFSRNGSIVPHILTVHKSKGLEFPVVFLCDMEEGVFPSYQIRKGKSIKTFNDFIGSCFTRKKGGSKPDISEERRLFYVAVTRAQKYLFLLFSENKYLYGRNHKFSPSCFLKYMR